MSQCHWPRKPPDLISGLSIIINRKSALSKQALHKILQLLGWGQCRENLRLRGGISILPQGHMALLGSHIQITS